MVCPSDKSPLEKSKECHAALGRKCDIIPGQGFLSASLERSCRARRAHNRLNLCIYHLWVLFKQLFSGMTSL